MEAYFTIYGHRELCTILRAHGHGTFDVQRKSDGRCFRVSGIAA
ncbi:MULTISPECIES: hypothetical protein [Ralstonia]|uniref:Uncharacterized protein n=1 Tax=Ralstonia thomasii TaxID=3058596 RepID=A0AAD2BZB3_9RALS|nr:MULTISPECIES: hypothetical protein [Ralstonia]CAJ0808502.1 hypothetical protein R77560_04730 [Ralstonia sp. LMG 18095]